MKKPRQIIRSFVTVGFGVTAFILAFTLGTVITSSTGIPLLGGLVNGVIVSMVLTIGLLSIQRLGTATLMWLVFSLLAIFTTTLGPPGPYKVVMGVIAGAIWDIVYFGTRRKTFGLFMGAILGAISIMGLLVLALKFGFGADAEQSLKKYMSALYVIIIINVIVTSVGVFLGQQVYINRLVKIQLFRDLKSETNKARDEK